MKNSRETLKQALERQRRSSLALKGVLDFSGLTTENFEILGNQSKLVELYVNNSTITSFNSLGEQNNLKYIEADNSRLMNFVGLQKQPRLTKISFINTPISNTENFRLAALVAIGQRLSSINKVPVTESERRMAKSYPPVAKDLVSNGWALTYPPPSNLDFQYLAKEFKIDKLTEDDFIAPLPPTDEAQANKSLKKQKMLLGKQQEDDTSLSFSDRVANLLRPLGFAIRYGADMNSDIVKAVSNICEVVSKVESIANEEEDNKE